MSSGRRRPARVWQLCLLVLVSSIAAQPTKPAYGEIEIPSGKGDFRFVDQKGDPSKPIPVFTYLPPNLKASEAPIVFVMHGHHRSAESYRNNWAKHADHFGFMVLAPLFGTTAPLARLAAPAPPSTDMSLPSTWPITLPVCCARSAGAQRKISTNARSASAREAPNCR